MGKGKQDSIGKLVAKQGFRVQMKQLGCESSPRVNLEERLHGVGGEKERRKNEDEKNEERGLWGREMKRRQEFEQMDPFQAPIDGTEDH
ncbi:hypothetical protein N7539_005304 [Penicillium diatomitis]|uniref:Uncharacterized protein n=1 Tax=Penicillium diatomitis TaxID=2819901 RepID=A0A9W9X755_9EURO|nr:uncharacterized protein N7539_005304 [Penicillium diatomitis]KAJ5485316.1 hypothetical protein N7539_005304 [Penicillium diatomitis]